MLSKELLDILACPRCKERVIVEGEGKYLVCRTCKIRYPIENDIPIMLLDRAEPIE